MKNNWNKILNELSYRVSSGIPDLTNEQHLMKLWDILKEHNWSVDARVELLKNISGQPVKYDVEKDTLTKEQFIEIKQLRNQGEKAHNSGQHKESEDLLKQALKLLES